MYWSIELLVEFWQMDEAFGIPYPGKLYIAIFGLMGIFFVWYRQWFAPIISTCDKCVLRFLERCSLIPFDVM